MTRRLATLALAAVLTPPAVAATVVVAGVIWVADVNRAKRPGVQSMPRQRLGDDAPGMIVFDYVELRQVPVAEIERAVQEHEDLAELASVNTVEDVLARWDQ